MQLALAPPPPHLLDQPYLENVQLVLVAEQGHRDADLIVLGLVSSRRDLGPRYRQNGWAGWGRRGAGGLESSRRGRRGQWGGSWEWGLGRACSLSRLIQVITKLEEGVPRALAVGVSETPSNA